MSDFDLDYTYSSGRLQKKVDCSWGYSELIKSMIVNPMVGIQSYYDLWAERGLTAEVFEGFKSQAGCVGPQCSDSNTVWNKESCANAAQLPADCYCKCDGDEIFKNGKCGVDSNIDDSTQISLPIIGGIIGLGIIIMFSLMSGGKKDVPE